MKIFGVFDGHGPYGHKVSGYAQTRFLQHIKSSEVLTSDNLEDPDKILEIKAELIDIFMSIQQELEDNFPDNVDEDEKEDENGILFFLY